MIVKFLPPPDLGEAAYQGSAALSADREYVVLEVYCQFEGSQYFRIEHSPKEAPALFDTRLFGMVTSSLPSSWSMFLYGDGSLVFGPKAWQIDDFWQSFLDRHAWALEAYDAARNEATSGGDRRP